MALPPSLPAAGLACAGDGRAHDPVRRLPASQAKRLLRDHRPAPAPYPRPAVTLAWGRARARGMGPPRTPTPHTTRAITQWRIACAGLLLPLSACVAVAGPRQRTRGADHVGSCPTVCTRGLAGTGGVREEDVLLCLLALLLFPRPLFAPPPARVRTPSRAHMRAAQARHPLLAPPPPR